MLSSISLQKKGGDVLGVPQLESLASFETQALCTSLDVHHDPVTSSVVVVAGLDDGTLVRLRMNVPTLPGSSPSAIRLQNGDFVDTQLLTWARPHRHTCSSVSLDPSASTFSLNELQMDNLHVYAKSCGVVALRLFHCARRSRTAVQG